MHRFSTSSPLLPIFLVLMIGGCSFSSQSVQTSPPVSSPMPSPVAASPVPEASPAAPNPAQLLAEAADTAAQATSLAQSAESRDDWALVSNRWERAIALLDQVPDTVPEAAKAQQDIATYRRNLTQSQQQANRPVNRDPVRLNRPDEPEATESPGNPSPSAEPSDAANVAAEVALANHLRQAGARMYATYWCGYCNRQQELFGSEAAQQLEIIECDPRGTNPQVQRCRDANVSSFPTWEINGQLYPGMQPLTTLADLSGYNGPRTFRN